MKVTIKTSEIEFTAEYPQYPTEYKEETLKFTKELIEKIALETINIKERKANN